MKNRILLFDIMKALCVIEIVAFWHMFDYTSISPYEVPLGGCLTSAVLAAFAFASGFFLGKKEVDVKTFYVSRLKRFMLPLLTSLLMLYAFGFGNIDSLKMVVYSVTGLSCFIPPMATTLWFFSMMILCYLVTPFLLCGIKHLSRSKRMLSILLRGLLVYALIIVLGGNPRVEHYFLFYVFGMIADMDSIKRMANVNVMLKSGG